MPPQQRLANISLDEDARKVIQAIESSRLGKSYFDVIRRRTGMSRKYLTYRLAYLVDMGVLQYHYEIAPHHSPYSRMCIVKWFSVSPTYEDK